MENISRDESCSSHLTCLSKKAPRFLCAGTQLRCAILKINKNLREEIAGLKKDLTNAVNQYNAVVEQNKSLQAELREYREKISR